MNEVDTNNTIIYKDRTTIFSPTCMRIMDLFLANPLIYFTPKTACLTLNDGSYHNVKKCMNILYCNNLLTKEGGNGTNYYSLTKENMDLWVYRFRNYVLVRECTL